MQNNQLDFLKKAAETGRIPHAILLTGGNSEEIKNTVIEFAKFLNCPSEKEKPCNVCENCQKIEKGVFQDLFSIEPESSGEIEILQIKDLIWKLSLKSSNNFKIAIINKVHLMNQEAQNCFLKTLEEPKGNAVLMLISEYPDILLPTVFSRVQKIRFFSEKKDEIENYKKTVSDFLKIIKSDLCFRFKYVKDLSDEDMARATEILNLWAFYLRKILIKKISNNDFENNIFFQNYSPKKVAEIISKIQNTNFLLSTTNINSKLALENLLINI